MGRDVRRCRGRGLGEEEGRARAWGCSCSEADGRWLIRRHLQYPQAPSYVDSESGLCRAWDWDRDALEY